jgi:L-asparaginase
MRRGPGRERHRACRRGDGNSTDAAIAALEKAAKKGVAAVCCSRTGSGVVDRNVEINDDKPV